ncbi:MAG: C40 family peptidase [Candidatus Babeliales bacterium]
MKIKAILWVCALIQIVPQANLVCDPTEKMMVSSCVADLRCKPEFMPSHLKAPAMSKDIGAQDSQLLYGECVLAEPVEGAPQWMSVSVLGQKAWRNNQWVPYPGFILKSSLMPVVEFPKYNIVLQNLWTPLFSDMDVKSLVLKDLALGTKLEARKVNDGWWEVIVDKKIAGYLQFNNAIYLATEIVRESESFLRDQIVRIARLFVGSGTSYVWGGRSPLNPKIDQITGIDCSGLTNLCYLASGLEIPRDAGPQRRAANELKNGQDLKKADLIFFANDEAGLRISHVVMYVGNERVVESTGLGFSSIKDLDDKSINKNGFTVSDLCVREITIKDLIGVDLAEIENGKTISKNGKRIFLGSYFGPDSKIQNMRDIALGKNVVW